MKSQTRLLPRLDQLYTQKKSYEIHRKKIQSINRSSSLSKHSISQTKLQDNQQETKSQRSLIFQQLKSRQPSICQTSKDLSLQIHMQTIQQAKPGISYWLKKMNPHQKRIRQEQIKQNKRIRQKIKNTMSFITRGNELNSHQQHYSGMKKMLNRFSVDENTHKTKMRCEIVLTKINELQKSKLKLQQSRLMQLDHRNKSAEKLLKQNITQTNQKQSITLLTKRSKALSQKISMIGKQSTTNMKDHLLKRSYQNSITRENTKLQSKTNQIKSSTMANNMTHNMTNKHMPYLNKSSQRYNRVKTELIERASSNRLFNNSKLSNLSAQTTTPKISFSDYKIMKVNYTQPGPNGLRKMPSLQSNSIDRPRVNNMTVKNQMELKKHIANRIKTEGLDIHKLNQNVNKQTGMNKFDYQKKRIQRFLKSKSTLSTKEVNSILPNRNQLNSSYNISKTSSSKPQKKEKTNPIIEQKLQQKITTVQVRNESILHQNSKQRDIIEKSQQNSSACFATQIQ